MRILSWNINGIRTLPQYHPWNTFKDCNVILEELGADVICFQEMKSSRTGLPRDVAVPDNYTSFFSFPVAKGGYSGVAVYVDSRKVTPLKAEEGLSGRIQPKPPLTAKERISASYPSIDDINAFPDEDGNLPHSFDALDSEGRAVVVDFGLFVLINVYCPNETSDSRASFKMNYHLLLQERVRRLIEEEHREVIVVGDINVCASPLDHCDGHLPSNFNTFWDHPARKWFHDWLDPNGPMIDVVRSFWPNRKGLFTCWNMRIQARETNYGTRVDYILATRGLMKWIKHGDIHASLKGSDHCPIYIDLHEEITAESGETVTLRDAMHQAEKHELPRIAAKNWEEFSSKQTLLSNFFGRKGVATSSSQNVQLVTDSASSTLEMEKEPSPDKVTSSSQGNSGASTPSDPSSKAPSKKPKPTARPPPSTKKRKSSEPSLVSTRKKSKTDNNQASISTFFSKSSASQKSKEVIDIPSDSDDEKTVTLPTSTPSSSQDQLDADYRLALELSEEASTQPTDPLPSSSQAQTKDKDSKAAWSSLFTPIPPPNCIVHSEPAKKYTVNKPGPNKGRTFYLCSRPVGPGYDKGKGERLRDEVDHRYRCNFFKWASEVKRESSQSGKGNISLRIS